MTRLLTQVASRLRTIGPWSPRGRIGAQSILASVNALEGETQALSEAQLRKTFLALRFRAKSGEPIASLLAETYALVREAGRRALNMRHFDVQILGGVALSMRSITEMQTDEGKTLTATLPLALMALVVIDYTTGMMRFPDWTEKLPIEQIESQQRWIRRWLSTRFNQDVVVEPMIALPGWKIGRVGSKSVLVINPRNASKFFVNNRQALSADMVSRIASDLEARCRNIEPVRKLKSQ